jgi:hypothetical protein
MVQLLVADAIAECGEPYGRFKRDTYFINVDKSMGAAVSAAGGASAGIGDWAALRAHSGMSCDPISLTPVWTPVKLATSSIWHLPALGVSRRSADAALGSASWNLCLAMHLRSQIPGSATGQSLLMSDADQRELLDVIRQRSQMAVVQYGLLGEVFASATSPADNSTSGDERLGLNLIMNWAYGTLDGGVQGSNADVITSMGQDFATAVQLHATVAQESLSLFSRSSSARSPRSAAALQLGDDVWGPGSWLQRVLSVGYGGDPLAIDPGTPSTPFGVSLLPGTVEELPWPFANEQPYYRSVFDSDGADGLLSLARRYDALDLVLAPPGRCFQIDATASGPVLYASVEAALRNERCTAAGTSPCPTIPAAGEDYLLSSVYQVRPDHAVTAARYIGETLFPPHVQECGLDPTQVNATTAVALGAGVPLIPPGGSLYTLGSNNQIHVNAAAGFAFRSLRERAGAFAALSTLRMPYPSELDPGGDLQDLALYEGDDVDDFSRGTYSAVTEYKRTLGTVPALAMTREVLLRAAQTDAASTTVHPAVTFLRPAAKIMGVIDGEIGPRTLVVDPVVQIVRPQPPLPPSTCPSCGPAPVTYGSYAVVTQTVGASVQAQWKSHITYAAGDPFFSNATFRVLIYNAPDAGEWARNPQLSPSDAATLASRATAAALSDDTANGAASPQLGHSTWSSLPVWLALPKCIPDVPCPPARWSFVLERTPPGSDGSATHGTPTYSLLAANVPLELFNQRSAIYLSFDGSIGGGLERRVTPLPSNPVEAAYDGFDLPTRWVPPLMAGALGGRPDQTSVDYFSTLATASAEEAATAAKTALDGLIDAELSDEQAAEAAAKETARALQSFQSDLQSVCGANASSCLTTEDLIDSSLDPKWYPAESAPQCGPNAPNTPYPNLSQDECDAIHNLVGLMVQSLLKTRLRIAKPVLASLSSDTVPGFTEYLGGALQSDLIEQWRAIKAPAEKLKTLYEIEAQSLTAMDSYVLLMNNAHNHADDACSETFNWIQFAWHAYKAAGACVGMYYTGGKTASECGQEAMAAYSSAHAATDDPNCQAARSAQTSAEQASRRENADARAQMVAAIAGTFDAEAAMQQSTARIAQDLQKVTVAQAKYQLELTLAPTTNKTSFGLYRLYHAYDVWRAVAETESARRYALAMRRAIEAQFVVDLSTMKDDEAFVSAPASWADEVYDYDLSLPQSLGLTVGDSSNGQGIYVNKIKDYVQNLTAFVAGYAVKRPTAVSRSDIDLVTLPGLKPQSYVSQNQTTTYQAPSEWFLMCKGSTTWTTIPVGASPGAVCPAAEPAVRAKLVFELDPWGRYNGTRINAPFGARYNGRWQEMAVNFVGTGVRDCTNALDPIACGTTEYVPYNLRHIGPASVTDYQEQWHLMDLPVAQIEAGKGLAAEIVLDPLRDGWNTSYVSPIARTELELRPLGGAYELEFEIAPEIVLERIERVQLLVGSTSWVKQQ